AERKNRHSQFLLSKYLVVLGVLVERCELLESVVHVAWPRVQTRVVLARRLVDRLRICRQLIIETVEIDTFAALHQAVDVRSAEIEMPKQGAVYYLVPRSDTRQWRVDDHPLGDTV